MDEYDTDEFEMLETDALDPNADPESFRQWLIKHPEDKTMAVFGHKPSLFYISSNLLSGDPTDSFFWAEDEKRFAT